MIALKEPAQINYKKAWSIMEQAYHNILLTYLLKETSD